VSRKEANTFFEIRRSRVQGRGAFALRKIRKGTRIVEYVGERVSHAEGDRRYTDESMARHHTFLFIVDSRIGVDGAVDGHESKFINHSCVPHCETTVEKRRIYVVALRTIQPGEELFYDYRYDRDGETDAEAKAAYPCHCGSEKCRGTIMLPAKKTRAKKKGAKKSRAKRLDRV
jgi:SET domain-containing protein